jgi:hypothetical protein
VHGFQHTKHAVALMGEQGAEWIHAKFKLKLKSILKEYYLNAPLHMDQLQYRGPWQAWRPRKKINWNMNIKSKWRRSLTYSADKILTHERAWEPNDNKNNWNNLFTSYDNILVRTNKAGFVTNPCNSWVPTPYRYSLNRWAIIRIHRQAMKLIPLCFKCFAVHNCAIKC